MRYRSGSPSRKLLVPDAGHQPCGLGRSWNNCLRMSGASAASARCAHALAHLLAMVPKVPQSLIGLPYDRFFA